MFSKQRHFWFENRQNCIPFAIMKQIINNETSKICQPLYAFTVRGENIETDLSVAHRVGNWIIY